MLKEFLENSKTAHLIKRCLIGYDSAENVVTNAYKSSLFLKLKLALYEHYRRHYKIDPSVMVAEEGKNTEILTNSKVVGMIKSLFGQHTKGNSSLLYLRKSAEELYSGPFKQISAIMLVAVSANILFLLIIGREVIVYGWLLRFLLLLISFCGLSCTASLKDIFENSIFFKLVNKPTNEEK